MLAASLAVAQVAAQGSGDPLAPLRGNWLGSIEIAPGRPIRIGIQILEKADGRMGANLASIDQGERFVPDISANANGDRFALTAGTLGITIEGIVSEDSTVIEAAITQGNASDPITFRRVAELPATEEEDPRLPRSPFPYASEDVRFENKADGVWLAGTLARPAGNERVPAVVFVGGSGPRQRDYLTSLAISDHLARQGIATLRYDKRGIFQSTGRYGDADQAEFARDAASALRYLASRADIEASAIGYIGHSEGSQVSAQAVADFGAEAAFLVSMAGVGLTALETLVIQDGTESAAAGATPDEVTVLRAFSRRFYAAAVAEGATVATRREQLRALYDALAGDERETVTRWYGSYGRDTYSLNPIPASSDAFVASFQEPAPTVFWRRIGVPVLVLGGGKDSQVPAREHVPAIVKALVHPDSASLVFPDANHMFQTAVTGAVAEYDEIDEAIAPEVLAAIGEWLGERR